MTVDTLPENTVLAEIRCQAALLESNVLPATGLTELLRIDDRGD